MPKIKVALKDNPYPIIIGDGITDKLLQELKRTVGKNRLFIFYDANYFALHGGQLSRKLKIFKPVELTIPSGEKSKSRAQLAALQDFLLENKVSRSDFILACGGGVCSDLVGYLASSTLRGINWGILSTTLLGMVDAAIGGKTGINSSYGKNLIGAFWQPSFVINDSYYLNTLSNREYISGLGEIVKYGGLLGDDYLGILEKFIKDQSNERLTIKIISESVRYKAKIVADDEREGRLRMRLNFGHTIGHAIEKEVGYNKIKHGEAILLGLWAAVELSLSKFSQNHNSLLAYQSLIEQFIAFMPKFKINRENLVEAISHDKKRTSGKQNFILIRKPGYPIIIDDISPIDIKKAIKGLSDRYNQIGARNA